MLLNKIIRYKMQQCSAENLCPLQLKLQFLFADIVPWMTGTRLIYILIVCLPEVSCPRPVIRSAQCYFTLLHRCLLLLFEAIVQLHYNYYYLVPFVWELWQFWSSTASELMSTNVIFAQVEQKFVEFPSNTQFVAVHGSERKNLLLLMSIKKCILALVL